MKNMARTRKHSSKTRTVHFCGSPGGGEGGMVWRGGESGPRAGYSPGEGL